jgi:small conductance mechanosensitive channel
MSGVFSLLAAAGLILFLGGAALWSGRFSIKRVRAFLADAAATVPVLVERGLTPVADEVMPEPSRCEFDLGVSYQEDPYKVIAILDTIGDEVRRDPLCGSHVMGPLEILGVDRFEDSAVVIRCRIATRPAGEERVGAEIACRLRKAFNQHVLEIPFPHGRRVPPLFIVFHDKGTRNGSSSDT